MSESFAKYIPKLRAKVSGGWEVYDPLRSIFVTLTPEEKVRQTFVHLLCTRYGYPAALMANEQSIKVGKLSKRVDTVVYNKKLNPLMLVEYKAPDVKLSQKVLSQILIYNAVFQVPYLIISNGRQHAIYEMDFVNNTHKVLAEIPRYGELTSEDV